MVKIAVLGAGSHNRAFHGPALKYIKQDNPDAVELVAVCDIDEEKARRYAEDFGFAAVYTDLDRMLAEEEIDGLAAITPVPLTEEIATKLLPVGIPLVIEKPAGVDAAANRRLAQVARETGTPHMVSLNRRFGPAMVKAREWIATNAADRPPKLGIARMLRHNRTEDSFRTSTGIHLVDATLSVMGRPLSVRGGNDPAEHEGVFYTRGEIGTELGTACCFLLPTVGVLQESYEFYGRDYSVQVDDMACSLRIFDDKEMVVDWQAPEGMPPAWLNGTVGEMQAFIDAIEGRGPFWPTLDDSLLSILTAEAIAAGGDSTISG